MKRVILLLLLIVTQASHSVEVYLAKDETGIPAEVSLLLRSLPPENVDVLDKKKIEGFVSNYSTYSSRLSKTDLFFIVKTEVSKLLLSSRPDTSSLYKSYDLKRLQEIEQKTDWPAYSPWAQYVFRSFLKDAKLLVNDARFPSLWLNSPSGNIEGLQVLRKRVELVLSWIDYFAFASVVSVNEKLEKLAIKNLGRIEHASWILLSMSYAKENSNDQKPADIFALSELKANLKGNTAQEILDKVVDPLLETSMTNLPVPVNDWVPREIENAPFKGETIIKKKDPFYSAPVLLPKPTNDWILSL
ncbi:MAG: hypothetical protein COW01_12375 [Bdellovibrionales bacterium CG12_big_fil_rev_8_21_14_0_65_38_15]|nr:MAG: hypothetical protein COW79_05560 [Bdellovibrionales bacterium CG22_combo_CG10-13_8_21_14_all_38_13]PIQ53940.1 MAG: hypothetical protein COW01_12375 [Bdellovibrionales bacterium CG12_big_fil_rev_8_21_14_0_65_38_15]PIR30980.1 MAG: hypothetical protein COV38_02955 [Bdellovibrionales bacterium CG11_big_fil_rev_8_21_14_0_20_38_13]